MGKPHYVSQWCRNSSTAAVVVMRRRISIMPALLINPTNLVPWASRIPSSDWFFQALFFILEPCRRHGESSRKSHSGKRKRLIPLRLFELHIWQREKEYLDFVRIKRALKMWQETPISHTDLFPHGLPGNVPPGTSNIRSRMNAPQTRHVYFALTGFACVRCLAITCWAYPFNQCGASGAT